MSTYTKHQAKQVDAKLAEDQKALYKALAHRDSIFSTLARLAGAKTVYRGRTSVQSFDGHTAATHEDIELRAADVQASGTLAPWDQQSMDTYLDKLTASNASVTALRASISAAHKEWENHGRWSRFFLVQGGHIHSSTSCHTLRPTTQVGWLPNLSGETEKDAVDAHGAMLCTICFPSAPVEWTNGSKSDDDRFCAGGRPTDADFRRRSVYGTCPTCGEWVSVTSTGKARKHKKAAK